VDWSNPDSFHLHALHEALLFAYPTPADLNNMLVLQMGQSYALLAPVGESYRNGLTSILLQARGGGWLADLVQKARQDRPQSPKLLVLERSRGLAKVAVPPAIGRNLEDIVRADGGFMDLVPWVEKLEGLGRKTCRIEYPVNTPRGTGWLVGPDLIVTNWHVIEKALPGGSRLAADYVCRFDYAATATGVLPGLEVRFAPAWCVDSSPAAASEMGTGADLPTRDTLDFALIRLASAVGAAETATGKKRGWVQVMGIDEAPKARDIIFVIQHPDGLPVKIEPGDVSAVAEDGLRLFHTANTCGGSSGSVVVNARLDPIALHHAGDALYQSGTIGAPERNQAIPMDLLVKRLEQGVR
jgi:hypothetical protein